MNYFLRLLIALDQLLNVLLCDGEPDETMSANAYRMQVHGGRWGFLRGVIDWLAAPFQADHCRLAYESEQLRLQSPPDERPGAAPMGGLQ
jgi:hypothetical protein